MINSTTANTLVCSPSIGIPSARNLICQSNSDQQEQLLSYYISCLRHCGQSTALCLPIVNAQATVVLYGHTSRASYEASRPPPEASQDVENVEVVPKFSELGVPPNASEVWDVLESTAWQQNPSIGRPNPPFRDDETDNSGSFTAPLQEPVIFQLQLANPLSIPLKLKAVTLSGNEVEVLDFIRLHQPQRYLEPIRFIAYT